MNSFIYAIPSQILAFMFIYLALTLMWGCKKSGPDNNISPNVLIILTDDMGYGDISCYDKEAASTPHIDKLAEEGVLCTDFYVPTPYCAPSRATLLTGRFPLRHGVIQNPAPDAGINDVGIGAEEVLLGELFQSEGLQNKTDRKMAPGSQRRVLSCQTWIRRVLWHPVFE
jgi:hypothetical protein